MFIFFENCSAVKRSPLLPSPHTAVMYHVALLPNLLLFLYTKSVVRISMRKFLIYHSLIIFIPAHILPIDYLCHLSWYHLVVNVHPFYFIQNVQISRCRTSGHEGAFGIFNHVPVDHDNYIVKWIILLFYLLSDECIPWPESKLF